MLATLLRAFMHLKVFRVVCMWISLPLDWVRFVLAADLGKFPSFKGHNDFADIVGIIGKRQFII